MKIKKSKRIFHRGRDEEVRALKTASINASKKAGKASHAMGLTTMYILKDEVVAEEANGKISVIKKVRHLSKTSFLKNGKTLKKGMVLCRK